VGGISASIGTSSNHTFRLIANSNAAINITPAGEVGIGTTNPGGYALKVSHSTYGIAIERISTGSNWELFCSSPGKLELYHDSSFRGAFNNTTGIYTALSDERVKTNIQPMHSMLDKILLLKPSTYQFKNGEDKIEYNGFIAQEVMKLFPSLVLHNVEPERNIDVYTMDYSGFGVLAIKGIQEQQIIIEEQQAKIADLEARLINIEVTLSRLTSKE
jgi:hypothetical protein